VKSVNVLQLLSTPLNLFEQEVLYDFRVEVGASSIPGAKLGAFLTYIGARKLRESAKAKGQEVYKGRCPLINELKRTVEAKYPVGNTVTVKVTGEHLLGRNSYDYVFADEINNEPPAAQHPEPISRGQPRIGSVGAYVEDDYLRDSSTQFNGKMHSIDLGRYGKYLLNTRLPTLSEFNACSHFFPASGWWKVLFESRIG
jgi:hypothetical protein